MKTTASWKGAMTPLLNTMLSLC